MSERLTTLALVAKSVDYGEADRICTLLSERAGKVSVLARAARKSRKRFGGALGLFVLGEAELGAPRRGSELRPLERFDAREDLAAAIGGDLVKLTHGSHVLELARELWPPEAPEPRLFALVLATLRAIAAEPPSPALLRCYELGVLSAIGLSPAFECCVRCGAAVAAAADVGYSVTQGGVICGGCGATGWPLAAAARREILVLGALEPAIAVRYEIPAAVAREIRDLLLTTLHHHLGRELRSWQFLAQIVGAVQRAD